jgi:diguanylate cyclase (GGDEF)-like protein
MTLTAALISICLSPASQAQSANSSPAESKLPLITTALQAHNLTDEEAARALPVHLRGVITYFDPDFGSGQPAIFFHDATGGIYIRQICDKTCKPAGQLFVGALVDVQGVSALGGFGPVVGNPQFRVLGRAPLPANPPRVSMAILKTGKEDAQWVEVEGTIYRVIENGHSIVLVLEMADGPIIIVMMKTPGATYSNLVDARVKIRGNAAPATNADGQMVGVLLQAPNLSTLQVLEPPPGDPFTHPAIPVDRLLHREYFSTASHRIHLRGNVTLQWPGSLLCIRDAARAICAETSQNTPVSVGDQVDLAGFVETENSVPSITNAIFRSAGSNRPVASKPVTAGKILDGGTGSELIQIDGLLIGYDLSSSDVILQLSSGDTLFPAILPKSLAGSEIRPWRVGSRVRVIGVCLDRLDVENHVHAGVVVPKSFRILMRSPADVTVLKGPSWWTPAHVLFLLGLAFTATLFVLCWVVILRRRVELQTDKLRESEKRFRHLAQHDSLTGLASRLVLEDRLKDALERARSDQSGLALLMLDLDKFKDVNDTYGHQAGDEVLRATAQRLLDAVRASDTVVRLGGDEFVVLLSKIRDSHAAELVADAVVSALSIPVKYAGLEIPISVSVGIGTAFSGEVNSETLLRDADAALYRAKSRGGHCFQAFVAGMEVILRAKKWEQDT